MTTGKTKRILSVVFLASFCICAYSQNAEYVINRILKQMESGIECSMSLHTDDGNAEFHVLMKGERFSVSTPDNSSWYDGTTLWEAVKSGDTIDEVYISKPSPEEMEQSGTNPFLLIKNREGFSERMTDSRHLELKASDPNSGWHGISCVTVQLDGNGTPVGITASLINGIVLDVKVDSYKTNREVSESDFKFPYSKWPGAEIINLE